MTKYEEARAELEARLADGVQFLPDKPEETPASTLRALWMTAWGEPVSAEAATGVTPPVLDAVQAGRLDELIQRRIDGEPLAHITQRQQFMGLDLHAGPEALIPRKETEILARCVVDLLRDMETDGHAPLVIDVCTGAGNLPVAYAAHSERALIHAADLCDKAAGLARRNVESLAFHDRIDVRVGDLLAPFEPERFHGKVDVLSCNPPYISSGKVKAMDTEIASHEPSLAFDGGPFGISILQKLILEGPDYLRSGGWLVFEVGLGQGEIMARRLGKDERFSRVETHADEAGAVRVIAAQRS